ncbi:MAG: magnesium protoporphyrin IX methyltransferase [Pseudomonadota bacterium]
MSGPNAAAGAIPMTPDDSYGQTRAQLETYFDKTAADNWAKLTSDVPVSGIRATVRAGRDAMRKTLVDWLPFDLTGRRILDAGCGPGQLSVELANRGADVVAIDLSRSLITLAQQRYDRSGMRGSIDFRVGDMFDPYTGQFDHVVAMDSLIHYGDSDIARLLDGFARRTTRSIAFTFAPANPMLRTMHTVGKLFPRSDRAPAIQPVSKTRLIDRMSTMGALQDWQPRAGQRIKSGFYISEALEVCPQ